MKKKRQKKMRSEAEGIARGTLGGYSEKC